MLSVFYVTLAISISSREYSGFDCSYVSSDLAGEDGFAVLQNSAGEVVN